jgi:hypothetical protein
VLFKEQALIQFKNKKPAIQHQTEVQSIETTHGPSVFSLDYTFKFHPMGQ